MTWETLQNCSFRPRLRWLNKLNIIPLRTLKVWAELTKDKMSFFSADFVFNELHKVKVYKVGVVSLAINNT